MDNEISEIAKLTGRISKDPKSKLFVPLAEEYKKAGDIEMAIRVLLEGIKNNPDYITARSSLGKLLLAKGDLAGAQKEFEEVVKTIPDNVMAQKKLGDLFILQNRPLDALLHYKIAHSLNPGDEELASLISDIEAGQDVRTKIQSFKTKTIAERAIKLEEPASRAGYEPSPGPVAPQPSSVEPIIPAETPPVFKEISSPPFAETVQALAFSMTETEEPEEVLVVEPLEPEVSVQEPPAAGIILPETQELREEPTAVVEEGFDFDLSAGNEPPDEPVFSQDIQPETELFRIEDRGTIPTGVSEGIDAEEIVESGFGDGVIENIPAPSVEDISGKSDDFTTDTLAELYISQGFFEKAIEIYERMLVDKPNSRGLQDKLSWVRAEVARTVTPSSGQQNEGGILAAQEAREYIPVAESDEFVVEPLEENRPQQADDIAGFKPEAVSEAGEYIPTVEPEEMFIETEAVAESSENQPVTGPKEQAKAGEGAGFKVLADSSDYAQTDLKKDFEPREYVPPVPPEMEQGLLKAASHHEHEACVPRIAGRKETIARLETWLTTIKKEK